MFEYKYLKYKTKYFKLKGGFALSQDCNYEPFKIEPEIGDELEEAFLYPTINKYFTAKQTFYNDHLRIINDNMQKDEKVKASEENIKKLIDYFQSKEHNEILLYLLNEYIKDELQHYHV